MSVELFPGRASTLTRPISVLSLSSLPHRGTLGVILSAICIVWCSVSASKLFTTAYAMDHQQILVAYPCALFYGVFALITIF